MRLSLNYIHVYKIYDYIYISMGRESTLGIIHAATWQLAYMCVCVCVGVCKKILFRLYLDEYDFCVVIFALYECFR